MDVPRGATLESRPRQPRLVADGPALKPWRTIEYVNDLCPRKTCTVRPWDRARFTPGYYSLAAELRLSISSNRPKTAKFSPRESLDPTASSLLNCMAKQPRSEL